MLETNSNETKWLSEFSRKMAMARKAENCCGCQEPVKHLHQNASQHRSQLFDDFFGTYSKWLKSWRSATHTPFLWVTASSSANISLFIYPNLKCFRTSGCCWNGIYLVLCLWAEAGVSCAAVVAAGAARAGGCKWGWVRWVRQKLLRSPNASFTAHWPLEGKKQSSWGELKPVFAS